LRWGYFDAEAVRFAFETFAFDDFDPRDVDVVTERLGPRYRLLKPYTSEHRNACLDRLLTPLAVHVPTSAKTMSARAVS